MSSKTLSQLLRSKPELSKLIQKAKDNEALLHLVKSRLPDPLCDHCMGAGLDGAMLQLIVDSPAWNTRLRFMQGALIQALGQAGMQVKGLKVITRNPDVPTVTRRPYSAQVLDKANTALIRQTAACIKDEGLRQALERIARHSATADTT